MRGDGDVAGEGRVVGVPKFHSWGKCTMPITNINSKRVVLIRMLPGTPNRLVLPLTSLFCFSKNILW